MMGENLMIGSRVSFPLDTIFLTNFFPFSFQNMICKAVVRLTIAISLIASTANCIGEPPLEVVKQWNLVNFDFPYDWPVQDKDLYNGEQIVTTGFEIGDDRIFMALPRLFSGVPATIASVPRDAAGDSPVLKVNYPSNAPQKAIFTKKINFRRSQTGRTTLPVSSNTTAAISDWYRCTD